MSRPVAMFVAGAWMLALCAAAGSADAQQTAPPPAAPEIELCAPPPHPNAVFDLWGAQDALIAKCMARVPAAAHGRQNVYVIAINPHGRQMLFSREAKAALRTLAASYGGTASGGILLSNNAGDLMQVPLATRQNVARLLGEIGRRTSADPDDVLILYLTSHGGPDAALESALPGKLPILAISADSMAAALDEAGIRRRVLIVSACFAGSWIPALANDDTIVIAAARADRTSFGCAEDRPLTYFGEAFLTGPLGRGASLAQAFESAKKTVATWEQAEKLPPSQPQASVGRNMRAFWEASRRQSGPAAKPATARKRQPNAP